MNPVTNIAFSFQELRNDSQTAGAPSKHSFRGVDDSAVDSSQKQFFIERDFQ